MQICNNEECEFYSKKIIDSCANETLCNISECENYLKAKEAPMSGPFSEGLEGLVDYLHTESGQWVLQAVHGKLDIATIECLVPEEKDMVILLLKLRKLL